MNAAKPARLTWPPIIVRAAEIVESYDIPVTLRQLFYRLVMEQMLPNTDGKYKELSAKTAALRRTGQFPRLFDRGRRILEPTWFDGPRDAVEVVLNQYRRDRSGTQDVSLFLGVEKNALAGLIEAWFSDLGIPVLPLGGYSSESIDRIVKERISADGRPAVLIYAGDFDASGMDIGRNFIKHTSCWSSTIRIGLDEALIEQFALPVLRGKATDSRAPKFIERHPDIHGRHDFGIDEKGRRYPVQVELDAVDPAALRDLYADAISQFWDTSMYESVLEQESADRVDLGNILDALGGY